MGWKLALTLDEADEKRTAQKKFDLVLLESRVPTEWSLERRKQALAQRLKRKIRPKRIAGILGVLASHHRLQILGSLIGGAATYRQLVKDTGLRAGPLYHHVNQLRLAGLIRPKARDLYHITAAGQRCLLMVLAMQNLS